MLEALVVEAVIEHFAHDRAHWAHRPQVLLRKLEVFCDLWQKRADCLCRINNLPDDVVEEIGPPEPTDAQTCFHAAGRPPNGG